MHDGRHSGRLDEKGRVARVRFFAELVAKRYFDLVRVFFFLR
jgi:hypothetical protein